jgi:hypothetical protein
MSCSASNYLLGLTPLPVAPYMLGTFVGMSIWSLLYASLGGASRMLLDSGVELEVLLAGERRRGGGQGLGRGGCRGVGEGSVLSKQGRGVGGQGRVIWFCVWAASHRDEQRSVPQNERRRWGVGSGHGLGAGEVRYNCKAVGSAGAGEEWGEGGGKGGSFGFLLGLPANDHGKGLQIKPLGLGKLVMGVWSDWQSCQVIGKRGEGWTDGRREGSIGQIRRWKRGRG